MKRLTYEAILDHPALLEKVLADARRERAEAVHRLILAPLKALFNRNRSQPALRPEVTCHS